MRTTITIICTILAVLLVGSIIFFGCTASGRTAWNNYWHDVEKADDNTDYSNRKIVEDTCRAMISQYNSDKMRYETYKTSDDPHKQEWGEQAKIRANTTASTYNNYILKNSYIWKGNVPSDILMTLPYITE